VEHFKDFALESLDCTFEYQKKKAQIAHVLAQIFGSTASPSPIYREQCQQDPDSRDGTLLLCLP
jgi:hypothetical protein